MYMSETLTQLPKKEEVASPDALFYLAVAQAPMDDLMYLYKQAKVTADALENEINDRVIKMESTVDINGVKATFRKGKRTYDYEKIADATDVPDDLVKLHTVEKIDWKKIVDASDVDDAVKELFATTGKPTVSIKIEE